MYRLKGYDTFSQKVTDLVESEVYLKRFVHIQPQLMLHPGVCFAVLELYFPDRINTYI